MDKNNTSLNVTTINLTSLLPEKDVTTLPNGDVLFSPIEASTFLEVILSRKDNLILVTPKDYYEKNALAQLFSDEAYTGEYAYSFKEEELVSILEDDIDYITSIVALLESYQAYDFIDSEKLLNLIDNLKTNAGHGIPTIMLGLEYMSKDELARLFFINEQMPSHLNSAFKKVLCDIEDITEE